MSLLYVTENGAVIGLDGGNIYIKHTDDRIDEIPKNTVTGISLFGQVQMTASMTRFCFTNGIRVGYFSANGNYYGTLTAVENSNVSRMRKQFLLSENEEFCLAFAKKIINAKIHNQLVVARRYIDIAGYIDKDKRLQPLKILHKKVIEAGNINELMGYEGNASRVYFDIIAGIIDPDFKFGGRSRRPAYDPFNAMLNMGYYILNQEIHGELTNRELYPYVGFMHSDKTGHAALASDMIEEWRPVIVDSVVLSLIQGHEISLNHFEYEDDGACRFTNIGMKLFFEKLEHKMHTENKYLSYIKKDITFRQGLWHQAECLARAVDCNDVSIYEPIMIR